MARKRKGRLQEFQRRTDNADLEEQKRIRQEKLAARKQEIESKRTRKNPEERKKYKLNRKRVIRLGVILIAIIFVGVSVYGIGSLLSEQADLEEQNAQLKEEKQLKEEEEKKINTDEYMEKKARDDLKMVKPGEKLFILDKDKESSEEE